jgi:glycosyltransferase involved in cell wall biosynthesis
VRELYARHDVLYHPVEEQGGWLVPFEAMCANLPIVISEKSPAAGLIRHNKLGLVDCSGIDIFEFVKSKAYEKADTKRSQEWVKSNFTWEKYGERMLHIFEEVAK